MTSLEIKIANLNKRAENIWLDNPDAEVISVCTFIHPEHNFAQAWFAHWNGNQMITRGFEEYTAEGRTLNECLDKLDTLLNAAVSYKEELLFEGDMIVNEIGFGD